MRRCRPSAGCPRQRLDNSTRSVRRLASRLPFLQPVAAINRRQVQWFGTPSSVPPPRRFLDRPAPQYSSSAVRRSSSSRTSSPTGDTAGTFRRTCRHPRRLAGLHCRPIGTIGLVDTFITRYRSLLSRQRAQGATPAPSSVRPSVCSTAPGRLRVHRPARPPKVASRPRRPHLPRQRRLAGGRHLHGPGLPRLDRRPHHLGSAAAAAVTDSGRLDLQDLSGAASSAANPSAPRSAVTRRSSPRSSRLTWIRVLPRRHRLQGPPKVSGRLRPTPPPTLDRSLLPPAPSPPPIRPSSRPSAPRIPDLVAPIPDIAARNPIIEAPATPAIPGPPTSASPSRTPSRSTEPPTGLEKQIRRPPLRRPGRNRQRRS